MTILTHQIIDKSLLTNICQIFVNNWQKIDNIKEKHTLLNVINIIRKLKTKHWLVNINDWGQELCYQITVNPIYKLPENKRRWLEADVSNIHHQQFVKLDWVVVGFRYEETSHHPLSGSSEFLFLFPRSHSWGWDRYKRRSCLSPIIHRTFYWGCWVVLVIYKRSTMAKTKLQKWKIRRS